MLTQLQSAITATSFPLQETVERYNNHEGVSIPDEIVIWGALAFSVFAFVYVLIKADNTLFKKRFGLFGVVGILAVLALLFTDHYVPAETKLERAIQYNVEQNFEHSVITVQAFDFDDAETATVEITSRNGQDTATVDLEYVVELGLMVPQDRAALDDSAVKIQSGSPLRYLDRNNAFPSDAE